MVINWDLGNDTGCTSGCTSAALSHAVPGERDFSWNRLALVAERGCSRNLKLSGDNRDCYNLRFLLLEKKKHKHLIFKTKII